VVTDTSRTLTATAVGAVVGGLAGFLFFTARGRDLRARIEPALDELANELSQFRGTALKAAAVASDGWKLLSDALAGESWGGRHTVQPRQTSPF
jgi:hypothetical protein